MYREKELVALFTSNTTEYSGVTYITGKLRLNVCFLRIELVVKLVFEVKSAVDFPSPYV